MITVEFAALCGSTTTSFDKTGRLLKAAHNGRDCGDLETFFLGDVTEGMPVVESHAYNALATLIADAFVDSFWALAGL